MRKLLIATVYSAVLVAFFLISADIGATKRLRWEIAQCDSGQVTCDERRLSEARKLVEEDNLSYFSR